MSELRDYEEVTANFKIETCCYESMPCQHYVKIDNLPWQMMYGTDIYEYCMKNNIPVPEHFLDYKEIVDRRKFNRS